MYSGRGAAKSWSVAQALLILGLQNKLKILCLREFQVSLNQSVYSLLCDINLKFNLGYIATNTTLTHHNGTEISFYGLARNIESIKSFHDCDIAWVEEASTISQKSLDVLIPTIRKENSELWFTWNPDSEHDAIHKMFITPYKALITSKTYVDQQCYILRTSYKENPFITDTMLHDIDVMKTTNYKQYLHIYGGNIATTSMNCIIQPEHFDAVIDAHLKLNIKIKGERVIGFDPADTGQDSKAFVGRHGVLINKICKWNDGDLSDAVERVYNEALNTKVNTICYDSIGIGAGAKIKFKAFDPDGMMNISPFVGSETPDEPLKMYEESMTNKDMFRNKRAQYFWLLSDRFEATYRAVVHNEYVDASKIIFISSECEFIDDLKAELTQIQRVKSSNSSKIQIESKSDMKRRGLDSPGLADSLMYAFANSTKINKKEVIPININYASQW